jgi:hypothetical protein
MRKVVFFQVEFFHKILDCLIVLKVPALHAINRAIRDIECNRVIVIDRVLSHVRTFVQVTKTAQVEALGAQLQSIVK